MALRVLHLEDDPNDRELVEETLRAEHLECTFLRAASREAFERGLAERPDVILADYSLPGFDGEQAQEMARAACPEVPFVFVTGSIGEERAVERLKSGATDYVLKDRLEKLATAVQRALREAEDRRERAAAETALRRLNAELEARVEERTRALDAARRDADRANQAKSEFLSRMSHDLRTPLNAIMGFAELLQSDPLTQDQLDSVTHIRQASEHLLNLINEILDIARIEAGHLTLSLEPVTVTEILSHGVALIQPLASQRRLAVEICADDEVRVFADRQRLNQILLNLLSNAVKYNRPGGSVRIGARRDGDAVQIDVTDTGAGIPPDKLALLFRPFERLGAEQTGIEGTGLGLTLAKRLAEAMGGTLTAESVVDQGSTFAVRLPASDAPPDREHAREHAAAPVPEVTGTVLYVEDNLSNAQLMRRILARRPGVVLHHIPDGHSALGALAVERPDLVILDLHLLDMPGEEVLRRIWENPQTRGIRVAILSADATSGSRQRLLAAGAFRYLTKPFEIATILQLIDEVLAGA